MWNKYVNTAIMSVRNCLVEVHLTEKRKNNFFVLLFFFFLCCQEKFAFQNVSFHLLIIGDFYVKFFSHKGFHNENLSLHSSLSIYYISILPRHIPIVTTFSRRSCFRRTECTSFYRCFSQTQQALSCECAIGACCEKYILLATAETFSNSQRVRGEKSCCLCSTRSSGRLQRWSSLFYCAQIQPLFWQSFLTESCLGSPDLPHHSRRKYSPSGFLEISCSFLLTQEEMENYIPYHCPLAEEGRRKYPCP